MNIRNIRGLKNTAGERLETARDAKKIIAVYAGINLSVSLLVTAVCFWLEHQISQQGGLSNMSTRTLLSTLNTVLPLVSNAALLCLELGYLAATIRMGRGLFTSVQALRAGMSRFWAMIRATLFILLNYFLAGFGCFYLASFVFILTPLSRNLVALVEPLAASILDGTAILDEATVLTMTDAMIPMFVLFGIVFALVAIPMSYQFRLVYYILMDKPHYGAMLAVRESKQLMRRNRFSLFRLDLSFWWYYLLSALASLLCYGDSILHLMGISLPLSDGISYFLFYGLYLAALFAIYYCFRNRVGITYALAYESLKPREETSGGVVLGNIFQM